MSNSFEDKHIIKFVYIVAMRDAVLQQAYKGEKEWLWDRNKIENDSSDISKIIGYLSEFIDGIISGSYNNQEDYNNSFSIYACSIIKTINESNSNPNKEKNIEFSFGNAQKLINIAIKYLYITTYKNETKRELFQYCHCPMDGRMLKYIWNNKNSLTNIDLGASSFYTDGWGIEPVNSERYLKYQKAVRQLSERDNCYPIEFDYLKW